MGEIFDLGESAGLFRWVQQHGLTEHPSAFHTLDRLWRAVHAREEISFFEDDSSDIDRVLEIFVRANSGGTVLSKSDLLLSVATAQFTQLDAPIRRSTSSSTTSTQSVRGSPSPRTMS